MDFYKELYRRITSEDVPDSLRIPLKSALKVIEQGLRLYGAKSLINSFNGGKDATVILHLVEAYVAYNAPETRVRSAFWEEKNSFREIDTFVLTCETKHHLDIIRYACSFTEGLNDLVQSKGCKAVFLGTRRADPNGEKAESYEPSSTNWPAFMRINPVLDWSYENVWCFLRSFNLDYCELYDRGYTSLGNTTNTLPNPLLLKSDGTYRPAYELAEGHCERLGRVSSSAQEEKTVATGKDGEQVRGSTVGMVVIGDEVLKGKVEEKNVGLVMKMLHQRGACLREVVIVPDEKEAIAANVLAQSSKLDVVLTSGGVGPTHDDITMDSKESEIMITGCLRKVAATGWRVQMHVPVKP
ncbi:hypothetical protein CYMTET_39047 [Cymbomonas tetramitiformis]|uniref:FAD synthase n=1 Tax=Cymbomonas tetramitiformis TaxID=36881 RepID=A0AAE0F5Z6_9CHLO|nr:hypothetical protein CYMTET_39047 [Cymbomonas tetramitiformis]